MPSVVSTINTAYSYFVRVRYRNHLRCTGPVILRINGKIEGRFHLGVHYGLWTLSPSFLWIAREAILHSSGDVYFYGDNIIRVEPGARLSIGDGTRINIGTSINVKQMVEIGSQCVIAQDVHIRDNDGHLLEGLEQIAPTLIEDKVWLGFGAVVLKGVRIGAGSVVGAKSVVTKDVPPGTIVAGNPARVVRSGVHWEL